MWEMYLVGMAQVGVLQVQHVGVQQVSSFLALVLHDLRLVGVHLCWLLSSEEGCICYPHLLVHLFINTFKFPHVK